MLKNLIDIIQGDFGVVYCLLTVGHSTNTAFIQLRVEGVLSLDVGDNGLGHGLRSINLFIGW